jgi:hypothetical protein
MTTIHDWLQAIRDKTYQVHERHTVVFDVDDTLCTTLNWKPPSPPPLSEETDPHQCIKPIPGPLSFFWHVEEYKSWYQYSYIPNIGQVLLRIALDWKWNVCIFSAADRPRVVALIQSLLEETLALYIDIVSAKAFVSLLMHKYGQFTIYAAPDMTNRYRKKEYWAHENDPLIYPYVEDSQEKKDLITCVFDSRNAILIDDNRSYVMGSQYPFLHMSFNAIFNSQYDPKHVANYTISDVADYIMGVLYKCKELLEHDKDDEGEFYLRLALARVLKKPDDVLAQDIISRTGSQSHKRQSLWYIAPDDVMMDSNIELTRECLVISRDLKLLNLGPQKE